MCVIEKNESVDFSVIVKLIHLKINLKEQGVYMLPRLASKSCDQVSLFSQPPKQFLMWLVSLPSAAQSQPQSLCEQKKGMKRAGLEGGRGWVVAPGIPCEPREGRITEQGLRQRPVSPQGSSGRRFQCSTLMRLWFD